MSRKASKETSTWLPVFAVGAILAGCGSFWLGRVNSIVPDPYLDEEFHVRQAQVYCKDQFHIWDPKITTPPGLYLVSWFIYRLTGRCSITDLRALNVVTVLLGYLFTYNILQSQIRGPSFSIKRSTWTLTAANIWLFPPLFFFSGLYYTDVQSAFWVLLSYQSYLRYERGGFSSSTEAFLQVVFGIIALFFRQTNIFWVAVFPAGLALISSAQGLRKDAAATQDVRKSWWTVCAASWTDLRFYDLPVYEARIDDYAKTVLSLAVVTVANIARNISILLPYFTLIAGFAAFVVWNGGVVLGDKSNHVATIHLPQMLYLWPYIMFFSWPVIAQAFFQGHIKVCKTWPQLAWKVLVLATFSGIAMVVVHYNTIVHPFTLADNRHYVFYVFRILLRHPAIKYLAAPFYILCGYAVLQTLGAKPSASRSASKGSGAVMTLDGCRTSFVLIWLITTALSLITAPLVEPRYCILPWIIWRMHVPSSAGVGSDENDRKTKVRRVAKSREQFTDLYGLAIELIWFLAVAVGTGYMFLYKDFVWPQEPGKAQRFMW